MLMILDKKQQEFIDIGSVVTKAYTISFGYRSERLLANTIG